MSFSFGFCQSELSGGDAWMSEPDMRKCLTGIRDIGASDVRMACVWGFVETARGQFNWGPIDRAVTMTRQFGLAPTLVVQFPPPGWSASAGDFGNFAKAVAARYGSGGTNQCANFEIMNEMNSIANLAPPNAQQYSSYLKAAYLGIKSVYPVGSNVISGGIMAVLGGFFTQDSADFGRGLYQTGCKGYFDSLGYHWYSNTDQFVMEKPTASQLFLSEMTQIRDHMVAQGDSAKKIWVTEFGFPQPTVSGVNARDWMHAQVDILNGLPWVDKWFIYNYRNSGTDIGNINNQWGVVDFNFTKKQPLWDYVATLNPGVSGASALPVTALASGTGTTLVPNTIRATGEGLATIDAQQGGTRPVTAVLAGSGAVVVKRDFSYTFTGSTKPTSLFADFGQGYSVSGGVAAPNPVWVNGFYFSGGIYTTDTFSRDQYVEFTTASGQPPSGDRSNIPIVRSDASGANWVGAVGRWGGVGSSQIITCIGGNIQGREVSSDAFVGGDVMRLTADGNTYRLFKNGAQIIEWVDSTNIFTGGGKRTGFGFQHVYSWSNWGPLNITGTWLAGDLRPVVAPPSGPVTITAVAVGSGVTSGVVAAGALPVTASLVGAGVRAAYGSGSLATLAAAVGDGNNGQITGAGAALVTAQTTSGANVRVTGQGDLPATATAVGSPVPPFTPYNVTANQTSQPTPVGCSGCWVTLEGAGARGGDGYGSTTNGARGGGGGGGGGAYIPRYFIPVSLLGSTYTFKIATSSSSDSFFTSGSSSLTAGSGGTGGSGGPGTGGTAGAAGVASQTGLSGVTLCDGAPGGAGSPSGVGGNGTSTTNGAGAGGRGGGGASGGGTPVAGTAGTSSGGPYSGTYGNGGNGASSKHTAGNNSGSSGQAGTGLLEWV